MLEQLRPEFPDVTISKIRFLESEGLVRPARTPSGYRQFTSADVRRLRFVLAAQRDHYLPLKVIKEQLDGVDRGLTAVVLPPGTSSPAEFAEPARRRMTMEELLAETGIDQAMLADLERYNLIVPGAAGFYDTDSAAVATMAKALAEHGIEPRHLRAFRASADREVGLLEQIVAPLYRQHDAESRGRADETVRELAALTVALHTQLVKIGLRKIAGQ